MSVRTIRRLFIALLSLFLLGLGALVVLISQNDALEQVVLDQIAASLTTRGHITEIDLNLWDDFPMVSLSLHDVWIAGSGEGGPGAGSYSGDTLLKAARIGLNINALSLLTESPQVEAMTLDDAAIVLAKRADGEWNSNVWKQSTAEGPLDFKIESLRLSNVHIQVDELGASFQTTTCKGNFNGERVSATIRANIHSQGIPLALEGDLLVFSDTIAVNGLSIAALGGSIEGQLHIINEQPSLNLEIQGVSLDQLQDLRWIPKSDEWSASGQLSGELKWDGVTLKGHAKGNSIDVELGKGLAPWWEDAPVNPCTAVATGTCWFRKQGDDWRIDVPELGVSLPGGNATGKLSASPGTWNWSGEMSLQPASTDWMPPLHPLEWTQGEVNSNLIFASTQNNWSIDANWEVDRFVGSFQGTSLVGSAHGQVNEDVLNVSQSHLNWGELAFGFNGKWESPFDGAPLHVTGEFGLPRAVIRTSDPNETSSPWWTNLDLPAGSEVNLALQVDTMLWEGNAFLGCNFAGRWTPQRIAFETDLTAWGGKGQGSGEVRWGSTGARMELAYRAEQVDIRRLFLEMDDFGQSTLRSGHLSGELTSDGMAIIQWAANGEIQQDAIRWQGTQTLIHGRLDGVEALMSIPSYLQDHRMSAPLVNPTDLGNKLQSIALQPITTPVLFIRNTFHIPLIELQSDNLHVTLEGTQNLMGEIDYSVGIEMRDLRSAYNDDIGEVEDDGLGNNLFIQVLGTVEEVEYKWDRDAQRRHRRKNFQEEKRRLQELWNRH